MAQVAEDGIAAKVEAAREIRDLIRSDPHRPIYHFVAPEGRAMPFDPNGAIYWKGKYHLGYIYQRKVDGEPQHVWGHAVSTDLLHWTIYPDMLDVRPGDPDQGKFAGPPVSPTFPGRGIFSGGAFIAKDGVPHVAYFSWGSSANLIARAADDDLKRWVKLNEASILREGDPADPKELICCQSPKSPYSIFDPDMWYDARADRYYQITGGIKPGVFVSRDMRDWKFTGPLIAKGDVRTQWYEDVSCPEFFTVGDKAVILFISHLRGAQYYIGTFADGTFRAEKHGRMNWPGGSFFAPEQLRDARGRNIIWAWVHEHDRPKYLRDYGWSGIMSLPRVLSLDAGGDLRIEPAEELKAIRLRPVDDGAMRLAANRNVALKARGKSIELAIEIAGGARAPYGVKVFASPDGREETIVRYEPAREELVIDFVKSSYRGPTIVKYGEPGGDRFGADGRWPKLEVKQTSEQRAPLKLAPGETLKLNIFLDRSIVEVFANGRQAITQLVYPELESSDGVQLFSGAEPVAVRRARSWRMAPTNAF